MQFILCKDNASERNVSLLANCRVQLILCKNTTFILFYLIILLVFHFFIRMNIDMEWNSRGSKENMRLSSSSSSLKAKLYKASCKNRFEK